MGTDIIVAKVELNVPAVTINGPSLEIGEMSRAGFEELGLKLRTIQGFNQFWIGDWANALHEQHGQGALREVTELLGYEYGTIRNYASIAAKYELSLRNDNLEKYPSLTFEHFRLAAPAPSPEFALEMAGNKELSTRELVDAIRKMKPATIPKEGPTHISWSTDPDIRKAEEGLLQFRAGVRLLAKADQNKDEAHEILLRWARWFAGSDEGPGILTELERAVNESLL